ncbi:YraN family protein [Luxibacter massiliensis]|uniref:YraN family protein n=1 Tax=Luxibacter massiliensis TaxID=2219695 RepID=UPI000F0548DB|nr:YraN family protein [Luxibacter massiliensis]
MRKEIRQNNRRTGTSYEQAAGYYLEQSGYVILEYNYRCLVGEIDIIAREGEYLVFSEVKYRRDQRKGSPLEAVDARKQKILYKCADWYLAEHNLMDIPCRFDVIGIQGSGIVHIRDAFCK